jgi:ribulose-5-phosphate 4-epimerase/fuculose-1-phosphate aldolase
MITEGTVRQARIDLAAAFRWAARMGMNEAIANHFSVATQDDGQQFLLNPVGAHFSRIRASDLLLLDAGNSDGAAQSADPTAWTLHATLHRHLPQARCVLHTHMPYATALACLKDFEFLMLDQSACRFYQRIAYDREFGGMALGDDEGRRIAALLGPGKSVLFMGNHGVMVVAPTVAQAFDELYYLERAAQVQLLALSSGRELAVLPEAVAQRTCAQWNEYPTRFSQLHFQALKDILDQEKSDYAA